MGIEHTYGKLLVDLTLGKFPHHVPQPASTLNQKGQRVALNIAQAFNPKPSAPVDYELRHVVLSDAIGFLRRQHRAGHMASEGPKGVVNEAICQGRHASIWYAGMAALLWLAWEVLPASGQYGEKVVALRQFTRQWWVNEFALADLGAVPEGLGTDELPAGSIILPGCRAYEEEFQPRSYHREAIYRELMNLPQHGHAERSVWWDGHAPDLVGPYYVANHRHLFPTRREIESEQNLPKLRDKLVVEFYSDGHFAHFPKGARSMGTQRIGTGGPTQSAWANYSKGSVGFDIAPTQGWQIEDLQLTSVVEMA